MASFPSTVKTFPTLVDLADSVLASHQNERGGEITAVENYLIAAATEKTVSSGVLTVDKSRHKIQPETGTSDDIDTISGMPDNSLLVLFASDYGTDTLTFKHGTGNLSCFGGSDILLSQGYVLCYYDGTKVFIAGGGGGGGLSYNSSTITTANLSCVEGNVYNCTIAGLTANRNAVLPAPSAAGKQIRINILDGDATYALIIIGDTGVTINGGSAATEWSRLFIANESVTLESTSTSNWQVIDDGRIPCLGIAQRQSAQSITTSTPTKVLIDTSVANIGGIVDVTTNNRIDIRRSGRYDIRLFVSIANSLDDQEAIEAELYVDGSLVDFRRNYVSNASANQPASAELNSIISLTAAQYVGLWIWHTEGASQNTNTTYYPKIVVKEIL